LQDGMATTVTQLRFRRLWIGCGLGFVLLVIYLSLTPDPLDIAAPEGFKINHFVAYAWLMIWFGQIYRTTGSRMVLAVALCALGIVLEYLQGMTDYRGFEYSDMLINSTGVALGLALAYTPLQDCLLGLESKLQPW
jgi:VanZ family protein